MGFRRAKSTQGNTNCQKNIFEDDQVPGHHPRALIRALSVLPTHLSANLVSPARPNELRSRKTFGVCRTRMPPCVCIDGPFRPHFARALSVRPTHLSANLVSPARPNELRSRKTFGVCRTRMPRVCASMGRFARTSLALERKGKEAFEPTGSVSLLSDLSAGRSQISN